MRNTAGLLFDPAVAAAIADLELVSRRVVEGFFAGLHPSPYHGFALEFASYREYTPGDDLRYLDWRVWARSDRFYVKQFEQTTNLACFITVDCSGSMSIEAANRVSKHRYALIAAGALGYLMVRQGDQVGFLAANGEEEVYVPAKSGRRHLFSALAGVCRLRPAGRMPLPAMLEALAARLSHRGMAIILSDFLHPTDELLEAMKLLVRTRSELVLFEILTAEEREFPYDGVVEFVDAEGPLRVPTQATVVRRAYLEALEEHRRRVSDFAAEVGADYVPLSPEEPLSEVLSRYLLARSRFL